MPCRRCAPLWFCAILTSAVLFTWTLPVAGNPGDSGSVYLPLLYGGAQASLATPTPTAMPTSVPTPIAIPIPGLEWDPRLDQRGAVLVEPVVTPGQGYWRLIRARWYDVDESQGRHHIFMDTRGTDGARSMGIPLRVSWADDAATVYSEAKPGEAYAADFAMYALAPAYAAGPDDGAPADMVDGMGLGEVDDPSRAHHTSYGLVWQWSIAPASDTPTPAATSAVTPTATPTSTSTASPTPTVTPSATPTVAAAFSQAEMVECVSDDRSTRVEGTVFWTDLPADGHVVVFSWQPDGAWSANPAISGPNPPGTYTHYIGANVGDWWVWVVDDLGRRISPMGAFSTDGPGGTCNVATVNFYGP